MLSILPLILVKEVFWYNPAPQWFHTDETGMSMHPKQQQLRQPTLISLREPAPILTETNKQERWVNLKIYKLGFDSIADVSSIWRAFGMVTGGPTHLRRLKFIGQDPATSEWKVVTMADLPYFPSSFSGQFYLTARWVGELK